MAAPQRLACARDGFQTPAAQQATLACWAAYYPWSRAAIDLGVPIGVTIICLFLANRVRHAGRQHFIRRLAELPLSPFGSTLFLRAFRDDQIRIRRASRNQETVTVLARDAGRIVLCLDASDGVRWEIAHMLQAGHTKKTLFFLNPSTDVATRTRLLMEDFGVSAADLTSLNLESILAVRLSSPDQPILLLSAKPERAAYLVAARLAFENPPSNGVFARY
jgi:hypothetical protein